MFVRIHRLRSAGRPIPEPEASRPEHVSVGDLQSVGTRFELRPQLTNVVPSDVLFEARVVSVQPGVGGMLIRGYEEYRGGAVLQEWAVTPLETVLGPDGRCRWNFSV